MEAQGKVEERGEVGDWESIRDALRSLGLPVLLFGEGVPGAARRLSQARRAFVDEGKSEFSLGSDQSGKNVFIHGSSSGFSLPHHVVQPEEDEGAPAKGGDQGDESKGKEDVDLRTYHQTAVVDPDDPHRTIHRFLKTVLKSWKSDLHLRHGPLAKSAAGKRDLNTQAQCADYIRPLFKMLKSRSLDPGQTKSLLSLVSHCLSGDFVSANDVYLDVAIGRAAWPIGVTMVGIHARAGREKIADNKVAHVMNSEMQRKYLTSVKRLVSYYQGVRVDVAPSKKVE